MTLLDRFVRALLLRHRHRCSVVSAESRRAFIRTMVMAPLVLPAGMEVLDRITLPSEPYNVWLLKQLASGDPAAREAFAAFIMPPIQTVIEQCPVYSSLFTADSLDIRNTVPSIPLVISYGEPPIGRLRRPGRLPSLI